MEAGAGPLLDRRGAGASVAFRESLLSRAGGSIFGRGDAGLPADAGSRKAKHRAAGEITLSQMLHEWALHDLGHVRQIAELVRARKYLAGAGPLGEDYQLKP